jgi:hypothetical protein
LKKAVNTGIQNLQATLMSAERIIQEERRARRMAGRWGLSAVCKEQQGVSWGGTE